MLGFRNGAGAGIIPSFWGISWVVVVVCQACWHLGKPTAQGAGLHQELPRATPCLLVLLYPYQWHQQVGGPVCFHGKHRITQIREPEIFIFSRLNVFIISWIWHIWGQYCPSRQSHISTNLCSWLGATQDMTMRRELRMLWDVMGWGCAGQAVLLKCRVDWSDQLELVWLPYDDGEEKLALGEDDTWHWLDSHEQ